METCRLRRTSDGKEWSGSTNALVLARTRQTTRRSGVKIVAGGVITGGLQTVEGELATLVAGRPAREWELMPAVFKADFDGVLTLHPGQVVGELPAIVGQEPKFSPAILTRESCRGWLPWKSINGGPAVWSRSPPPASDCCARGPVPKYLRPARAGRQRISAHEPAVPRNGGVVQQVGADDPVELGVGVVRRDALVKTISVVSRCSSVARFRRRIEWCSRPLRRSFGSRAGGPSKSFHSSGNSA